MRQRKHRIVVGFQFRFGERWLRVKEGDHWYGDRMLWLAAGASPESLESVKEHLLVQLRATPRKVEVSPIDSQWSSTKGEEFMSTDATAVDFVFGWRPPAPELRLRKW